MNQNLFLHPEVIAKSAYGAGDIPVYVTGNQQLDDLMVGGTIDRKLKGWSIPLLVRYRIWKLLFAHLGPQIDWLLFKQQDVFINEIDGEMITYEKKISSEITDFSFGFAGGLDYKLQKDKGLGFGVRYYHGLTDIMKTIRAPRGIECGCLLFQFLLAWATLLQKLTNSFAIFNSLQEKQLSNWSKIFGSKFQFSHRWQFRITEK